ncbi:phospholipase D1-like isoform X2 [Amphiura filiformis]
MPKRMLQLERYLQSLVANPVYRNHPKTLEFLEVSHLSFVEELGPKAKEGWVYKKSGGHKVPVGCCPCCNCTDLPFSAHYSKRWLITKDSYIAYVRPFDGHLRAVILMDKSFKVDCGREDTGLSHGLLISNQYRNLLLKANSKLHAREWMVEIMQMAQSSEYTNDHPHHSFAPERPDSYAQWFVDGATYFEVVADALEEAQQEIFITDWWLNPEIFLKRPAVEGERWRVDQILKRKAEEGVNIFILLYKEVEVALGLGSKNCKHLLKSLHRNIKILRHPDHAPGGVMLWAHHEKLVAIDQKVAFLGGLDICFGRWDDHKHRLADVGSAVTLKKQPSPKKQITSGDTMSDFDSGVDSTSVPEGTGSPHKESQSLITPQKEEIMTSVDRNLNTLGIQGTPKLWLGKDYCNFIAQDVINPHLAFDDSVDRMSTPRMPWHDIGAVVYGKAAADVSRHFIQRWNFTKKEKALTRAHYPLLLPKSTSVIDVSDYIKRTNTACKCQILRSACTWSAGVNTTEDSIHQAYLRVIKESKHYLYIENQFFITIAGDHEVTNQIADALFERICRAHRDKETFRVYVMLPLLPAFQGEVGGDGGNAIHAILHWEYKSICQGENSLLQRLKREPGINDPRTYITFYGLRNHGELSGNLVTELVYIHSKLMIADDNTVIIGSANINDRSMLGKRDSELAILVQDTHTIPSKMNGKDYKAGKFGFELRKWLFKEHLGVLLGHSDIDVTDPVADDFYKGTWMKVASDNTSIYEQVFKCIPTDSTRTITALTEYKKNPGLCQKDPEAARKQLKDVQGYLVWIPLQFLSGEDLQPRITTQEGIAPSKLWT